MLGNSTDKAWPIEVTVKGVITCSEDKIREIVTGNIMDVVKYLVETAKFEVILGKEVEEIIFG